ncbi:MAG TPA: CDP-alcohol phosphatidyltransferase family protein [Caulobacteraceae bacterium]|nr:CDP-alcohol phosphatidyltransferase family protein [Caulobacteraceae bacterium]
MTAPTALLVAPGPDVAVRLSGRPRRRIAGLPLHLRNRRVAERAGCVVDQDAGAAWTLVVPPTAAIETALFQGLPLTSAPVRLTCGPASAIWGPAQLVANLPADAALSEVALPEGALLDAASVRAAARATWAVLQKTGKPSDGPVARRLNRPLSRLLSFALLALRLTPLHGSLVCLATGLGAAVAAAVPTGPALAVGGLLYQGASVIDGTDGEMARARLEEGPRGALIDTAVDNVTQVACLVGFAVGWLRSEHGPFDHALSVLVLAGVPTALVQALLFTRRYAPDASLVFLARAAQAAGRRSRSLALRAVGALFPLLRRDALALILMTAAFTGSRELIMGLVAAGVLVGLYALNLGHRELVAAAADGLADPVPSA